MARLEKNEYREIAESRKSVLNTIAYSTQAAPCLRPAHVLSI